MGRPRKPKLPKHVRLHSSGKFRAVITLDGRRRPGPLRATPALAAEDAARMVRARAEAPARLWTLRDGLDEVDAELRVSGARHATLAYYRDHGRAILRAWDEATPLHAISPADIRTYIRVRSEAGISMVTIWRKELQVLSRIFNLAIARRVISTTPFAELARPRTRSKRFHWLPLGVASELLQRIRAWPGPVRKMQRDADIITLTLLTGLRRAELARLRPQDVELQADRIHVEGKTGNRYVPIADELRPVVERLLAAGKPLLVGSEHMIEDMFRRWKHRLGEPRLAPRALRHGFATEAASDTSVFELSRLMGHANLQQTQRYFHGRDDQSRAAVNSLGKRLASRSQPAAQSAESPRDDSPSTP